MTTFGLSERNVETIIEILSKYSSISCVRIFGSRAKGNYKTGSDIDLAIMNDGFSTDDLMRIQADFAESSLPFFVDIINYQTISHPELKEHIDRAGIIFYNK